MPRLRFAVFLFLLAAIIAQAQFAPATNDVPRTFDQWAAKNITPPELISGDRAEYPVEARFQLINGICLVSMVISIQGDPQDVRIIHCTDSSFEDSSLDAVKQYRFKPATTQEGKSVPVTVSTILQYRSARYSLSLRLLFNPILWPLIPDKRLNFDHYMSKSDVNREVSKPIRSSFIPQRGGVSVPDSDGIYPFTRSVTGPRVIKFADKGYGRMAFVHEGNSDCDVVLTINAQGKASDPQGMHCERPELEKPVIDSLLRSNYQPGMVKGKEVPMRASAHISYGDARPGGAPSESPEK
jgi:TonB family protein